MDIESITIARVAEGRHWHALERDEVVGRGHALRRPDGRVFLSADTWRDDVFDRLAAAMLTDLEEPTYTIVDDDDREVKARWRGVGFVVHRREIEYVVPTDPRHTRLRAVALPAEVAILPAGEAREDPLNDLDQALRAEIGSAQGWQSMPAEVVARSDGTAGVIDPSRYVVAEAGGRCIGLVRIALLPRRPRLGLVAVRSAWRRQGVARGMLAEALGALHRAGFAAVSAEVDERNRGARALFEGLGARSSGAAVELFHS